MAGNQEPDQLLALRDAGELLTQYPRVRSLLTDRDEDRTARAGRLLATLDPQEIKALHPEVPVVDVYVTGHGTVAGLTPALTGELARHGMVLRARSAGYGSYPAELGDLGSDLYAAAADLVLLVLDHHVVLDELPVPWRATDAIATLHSKVALISGLVEQFVSNRQRGTLVLNTLPLPREITGQLVDHRSRAELGAAWREANAALLRLGADRSGVVVIDLDPLLAEGVPLLEPRMSAYARAHLSPQLLSGYAREVAHLARHVTGATKKALVVDLDGTLWGGILGDAGREGIELGGGYRGEAFQNFQKVVRQLGSQGVVLAVVSKNDQEPVLQTLREHPGMVLKEDDFVRVVANWMPKNDNLTALAKDLNLGVDSLVFADDSPFECGLVRHALPGAAVVQLGEDPARHVADLLRDGWFDVVQATEEDRNRPAQYRDELARQDFQEGFGSFQDYLSELGVWVELGPPAAAEIARVSQVTLRTNQFNLTTERLQQPEVQQRLDDPDGEVLVIRSGDRFGANGLVGVVFTRRRDSVVEIGNFLLSCRVFSRGIEETCLREVLLRARRNGAQRVVGRYRRTAKNGRFADFYSRNGFTLIGEDAAESVFEHDLESVRPAPEHVRIATSSESDDS